MPVEMSRAVRPPADTSAGSEIEEISIKRAANGGAIVTCTAPSKGGDSPYQQPTQHAFGSMQEALDYATQKFGGSGGEAPAAPPAAGDMDDASGDYGGE